MNQEAMNLLPGLNAKEVERLLELSRDARWSFPSSMGNPVRVGPDTSKWADPLLKQKESFVNLVRFLVEKGDEETAVEVVANIWRLWIMSKDPVGGSRFASIALDRGTKKSSKYRALALYGAGLLAFRAGNLAESRQRNDEALSIAQEINDPESQALANLGLSRLAFEDEEYNLARDLALKAREFVRGLDPALDQAPLHALGQSNRFLKNYEEASTLLHQSVELNRRIGDKGMVSADSHNLGHVLVHLGRVDQAEECFAEAATFGSTTDPFDRAMVELNGASIAYLRGNLAEAQILLARCNNILKETGTRAFSDDQFEIDWLQAQLSERSGPI